MAVIEINCPHCQARTYVTFVRQTGNGSCPECGNEVTNVFQYSSTPKSEAENFSDSAATFVPQAGSPKPITAPLELVMGDGAEPAQELQLSNSSPTLDLSNSAPSLELSQSAPSLMPSNSAPTLAPSESGKFAPPSGTLLTPPPPRLRQFAIEDKKPEVEEAAQPTTVLVESQPPIKRPTAPIAKEALPVKRPTAPVNRDDGVKRPTAPVKKDGAPKRPTAPVTVEAPPPKRPTAPISKAPPPPMAPTEEESGGTALPPVPVSVPQRKASNPSIVRKKSTMSPMLSSTSEMQKPAGKGDSRRVVRRPTSSLPPATKTVPAPPALPTRRPTSPIPLPAGADKRPTGPVAKAAPRATSPVPPRATGPVSKRPTSPIPLPGDELAPAEEHSLLTPPPPTAGAPKGPRTMPAATRNVAPPRGPVTRPIPVMRGDVPPPDAPAGRSYPPIRAAGAPPPNTLSVVDLGAAPRLQGAPKPPGFGAKKFDANLTKLGYTMPGSDVSHFDLPAPSPVPHGVSIGGETGDSHFGAAPPPKRPTSPLAKKADEQFEVVDDGENDGDGGVDAPAAAVSKANIDESWASSGPNSGIGKIEIPPDTGEIEEDDFDPDGETSQSLGEDDQDEDFDEEAATKQVVAPRQTKPVAKEKPGEKEKPAKKDKAPAPAATTYRRRRKFDAELFWSRVLVGTLYLLCAGAAGAFFYFMYRVHILGEKLF